MTISELLKANIAYHDDAPLADSDEVNALRSCGVDIPRDYVTFVTEGGLSDLRFANRVLRPSAIVSLLPVFRDLVPFASNECGDYYCWIRDALPDENIVFRDHESDELTIVAGTLETCLVAWRF